MISTAMVCASHTPLLMRGDLAASDVISSVRQSFDHLGTFVESFGPEQIIQFFPDHFHGFHYDLMPSFCVGMAARSCGDWNTKPGPLLVDEDFSLALLEAIRDADVDAAASYDMVVDHGCVQMWETMFGRFDQFPIAPVFVNAVGHPLPKYRRARQLGVAVGRFAAATGRRVLFAASGGLSHDPIVPQIRGAPPEVRARLLGQTRISPAQQAAREAAVEAAGKSAMDGEGPCQPLNPEWDRHFLDLLVQRDWKAIDELTPETVAAAAGTGGNEVLGWVAAAAALAASGTEYAVVQRDYWPIPGWIAGMATLAIQGG